MLKIQGVLEMQKLQDRIVAWRDEKLDATVGGTIEHLGEEVADLAVNPYDPLSLADVGILWMSACNYAGFTMEEMQSAIEAKMSINESRLWKEADEKGVVRHIEETKI